MTARHEKYLELIDRCKSTAPMPTAVAVTVRNARRQSAKGVE